MPWPPPVPAFSAHHMTSRIIHVAKVKNTRRTSIEESIVTNTRFYNPEELYAFDLNIYSRFISSLILWDTSLSPIEKYLSVLHKPLPYIFNLTQQPTDFSAVMALNCANLLALGIGMQNFIENGCIEAAELLINNFLDQRKKTHGNAHTTKGMSQLNFKKFIGLYLYLKLHSTLEAGYQDSIQKFVDNKLKPIEGFVDLNIDLATLHKHKESVVKSVETRKIMPIDTSKAAFNSEEVFELIGTLNSNKDDIIDLIINFDALETIGAVARGDITFHLEQF